MEFTFRLGQYVRFIGVSDHELLNDGQFYEIVDIDPEDNTVQLWLNEGEVDDEDDYIDWWVSLSDIMPKEVDIEVDKSHPNWKVNLKIKQMYARRKAHGYSI